MATDASLILIAAVLGQILARVRRLRHNQQRIRADLTGLAREIDCVKERLEYEREYAEWRRAER